MQGVTGGRETNNKWIRNHVRRERGEEYIVSLFLSGGLNNL